MSNYPYMMQWDCPGCKESNLVHQTRVKRHGKTFYECGKCSSLSSYRAVKRYHVNFFVCCGSPARDHGYVCCGEKVERSYPK